jgi:hypothetical protein
MKNYTYTGTSILSFTFDKQDYQVYGKGPHSLPAESELVKTLVAKGELTQVEPAADKTKIKNT